MKRSDIRKGTIYIIGFCIVVWALITLTMLISGRDGSDADINHDKTGVTAWSDTLTNSSSAYAPLAKMDRDIEIFMQKWQIKGMSLAITRNDSLLYAMGYGWADKEAGIKMEPSNVMRIASASKLVTAIAIMKLCEEGKLRLDSRVFGETGILNDTVYSNAMCDRRMNDITVDHLLMHQGGFGMGAGDPMFTTAEIMAAKHLKTPPTAEELTKIVLGRRIAFTPGAGRRYSNFGYLLLSMVIERVTGKSYWDYVNEEILRPAGCYNFYPATNYYADRLPKEVKYYGPDDEQVEEYNGSGRMVDRIYGGNDINALKGAGGWLTSAADLSRMVAAADGDPRLKDIISPQSVKTMTTFDEDEKQARGWVEIDAKGKWTRTGTLSSTHTLIERFPDGECWVLITNSGVWTGHRFSHDMSRLVERLRAAYSGYLPRRNLF